jgi:hypothetical protein
VQHLHGLGAPDVTGIGPQEAVQCRPAVHVRLKVSWPRYPFAARAIRSLRRASNKHLVNRVAVGAELGGQGIQRNIVEHDRGENLTLARSEHTKIEDRLDAKEILTVGRYGSL